MKRVFGARLIAVAVLVVALGLLASVAWASAPSSVSSQQARFATVTVRSDTLTQSGILLRNGIAIEGRPGVTVSGSGFEAPGAVFLELVTDVNKPSIIIGGALVNSAGAFELRVARLDAAVTPGTYTLVASASDGSIITTPLTIIANK